MPDAPHSLSRSPVNEVQAELTPNQSTYIPDPSEEQALAAFNDLQDQFSRPHA
jgi:hypothetical protein